MPRSGELLTTSEAAERYDLNSGQISRLCREDKIEGAFKNDAGDWMIPDLALRAYLSRTKPQRLERLSVWLKFVASQPPFRILAMLIALIAAVGAVISLPIDIRDFMEIISRQSSPSQSEGAVESPLQETSVALLADMATAQALSRVGNVNIEPTMTALAAQLQQVEATKIALKQPTFTPTATATNGPKANPSTPASNLALLNTATLPPVVEHTLVPLPVVPISPENVDQLSRIARWGKGDIFRITLSADNKLLAVATSFGVHIYNVETLQEIRFIRASGAVRHVAFSPDGVLLAIDSGLGYLVLYRVAEGTQVGNPYYMSYISDLAFSPDATTFAIAFAIGDEVRLAHLEEGGSISHLKEMYESRYPRTVRIVAFSPDSKVLASAGGDTKVRLWRVADETLLHSLEAAKSDYTTVNNMAFSPDGALLATGSLDIVRLWRVDDGTLLRTFEDHATNVGSLAFSPDGNTLITGTTDGTVWMWRVSDGTRLNAKTEQLSGRYTVSLSQDGTLFLTEDKGKVQLWRVNDGVLLGTLEGYMARVNSLAFSPNEGLLATGSEDAVRLWRVAEGIQLHTLEGNVYKANGMNFSPDGKLLAATSEGSTVKLWRISDRRLLRTLEVGSAGNSISSVAFSPDGTLLASGTSQGDIILWQVAEGTLLRTLEGSSERGVESIAFSPDGTILASVAADTDIRLWRMDNGTLLRTLAGNSKFEESSIAFSPDGSILASVGEKADIRLWRVVDGTLLHTLEDDLRAVYSMAFNPNGSLLASSDLYGNVQLWRVSDGELLHTVRAATTNLTHVRSIAFSPDGRLLALGEDSVQLWGQLP